MTHDEINRTARAAKFRFEFLCLMLATGRDREAGEAAATLEQLFDELITATEPHGETPTGDTPDA